MTRPKLRKRLAIYLKGTPLEGEADAIIPLGISAFNSTTQTVVDKLEAIESATDNDSLATSEIDGLVAELESAIADLPS